MDFDGFYSTKEMQDGDLMYRRNRVKIKKTNAEPTPHDWKMGFLLFRFFKQEIPYSRAAFMFVISERIVGAYG